jgi:hypothetical protein
LISNLLRDEIAVEVNSQIASKVALRPGRYSVRAWKSGRQLVAGIRLADRAQSALRAEDFVEVHNDLTATAKGAAGELIDREARWNTFVALGWTTAVAQDLGAGVVAARVGMRTAKTRGFTVNIEGAIGETTTFTEYRAAALLGYGLGRATGRFSGFVSGSVGGGIIGQRTNMGQSATTPTGLVSPAASGAWWLTRHVAIGVEAELSLAIYKRDSQLVASLWPVVYGGIVFAQ